MFSAAKQLSGFFFVEGRVLKPQCHIGKDDAYHIVEGVSRQFLVGFEVFKRLILLDVFEAEQLFSLFFVELPVLFEKPVNKVIAALV